MSRMTQVEYLKKRDNYARSEAPLDQRAKAIEELDKSYLQTDSVKIAKQQFEESAPDSLKPGEN